MKQEKKIAKCYNCKNRTEAFKIRKLTHYHCMSPTYQKMADDGDSPNPWETLRVFSDTCSEHEYRTQKVDLQTS
jgi:hypothetical protein